MDRSGRLLHRGWRVAPALAPPVESEFLTGPRNRWSPRSTDEARSVRLPAEAQAETVLCPPKKFGLRVLAFRCAPYWLLMTAVATVAAVEIDPGPMPVPGAAQASSPAASSSRIIVKYHSQGANALNECAERLTTRGESFAQHTADSSDSLDRLHDRLVLGRHRALFRKPGGPDFASERRALRGRLARSLRRSPQPPRLTTLRRSREAALPDLSHIYRVSVPSGQEMGEVLAGLRADPHVAYAQPDHRIELDLVRPAFDDPFLSSQGSWGQPYGDLWGLDQIRAPAAWSTSVGQGVVVAVVDTGLDRFHPDISANVWVNPGEDLDGDGRAGLEDENGIDDDGNGFIDDLTGFDFAGSVDGDQDGFYDSENDLSDADPFDERGHGTHVSGTIAAVADNGIGIAGVAPGARIMTLKGFPDEGSARDSVLWRAVLYAAENGASVINNSWSCGVPCPTNPLAEEILEIVAALGTVVVTSAGNASRDVVFSAPENGDGALTVGALGWDERLPGFTNRGWGIDVVAPGGGPNAPRTVRVARSNILSLLSSALDPEDLFPVGELYARRAGTSMASPHVAGSIALLRSLRGELSPEEIRRLIRMSARDLGPPGHDPSYGAGLLDVPALLAAELPDLALRIESPRPGSLHDPAAGPVRVFGQAGGGDLADLEFAVARGLFGRDFYPLEGFGTSRSFGGGSGVAVRELATWDLSDVPDGPHVLRMRARLFDGRIVDEYLVLGVEGSTPVRASGGTLKPGNPALSGRLIVWPAAESEEPGAPFDLEAALFPADFSRTAKRGSRAEPRSKTILEHAGSQDDVSLDGRTLAWRVREGTDAALEWCRLDDRKSALRAAPRLRGDAPPQGRCEPRVIDDLAPGFVSAPMAAGGWIVWWRDDLAGRVVEGCLVDAQTRECRAAPLIENADGTTWTLRSFDGRTLLLQAGGRWALCSVDSRGRQCSPQEIVLAAGTPPLTEPVHDGRLIAFGELIFQSRPPPGCLPGEFHTECLPSLALLVRYHACELDSANVCASIPISAAERVENVAGLEVEGRRIVWSMASEAEEASIRFCEYEPSSRECVEQRLSGSLARQDGLAIDGHRLVWRDARAGEPAIWSHALPDLSGQGRVKLRTGRPFSIPLLAQPGTSGSLGYSIVAAEGFDPILAGAKIHDPGRPGGRVYLRGTFAHEAVGSHRWRIRARGAGGLFSEWEIEIEVAASPNDEERKPRRIRSAQPRSDDAPKNARRPDR